MMVDGRSRVPVPCLRMPCPSLRRSGPWSSCHRSISSRGLAVLDRRQLSGVDLRPVLAAEARLLAWVQAGMAATVNELTQCPPTSRVPNARTDEPQEFAVEEVALILRVSAGTAGRIVDAAYDAVVRHPGLWRAWRDGEVDARKVAVVGRVTSPSTAEQAATVDRILLDRTAPTAGGWSAWEETVRQPPRSLQHRAQVSLAAIDADAGWVRTESALQRRRLVRGATEGVLGVGFLAGYDLPIADVAAAYQRVDGIARGIKRAGDDRLLDQLRGDVFIDLLLGHEPRADGSSSAAVRASGGRAVHERRPGAIRTTRSRGKRADPRARATWRLCVDATTG